MAVLLAAGAISLYSRPRSGDSNLPASTDQATPAIGGECGAIIPAASEIPSAHTGAVYALEFSPDGALLFSAGNDGVVRAWDLSSGKRRGEIRDSDSDIMIDIAVLPSSPHVVAGSYSGRAYVWNWMDGRIERIFDKAIGHVESVAVVGGTRVVTSGVDDALYLWDAASGTVVAKLPNEHEGGVRALAVDPSGRYLVAGDYQGNLSLWDLAQHTQTASLKIGVDAIAVWSLDWAPDGESIAIGGVVRSGEREADTGLLVIYDPFRREVVRNFAGHDGRVNAVCFSRDEQVLYSAAEDLRIWSRTDGEVLQHEVLSGGEIFGLAESVDGAFLAASSSDGTIHFVRRGELPSDGMSASVP